MRFTLVLLCLLVLAGCAVPTSTSRADIAPTGMAETPATILPTPAASAGQAQDLARRNSDFAIALYRQAIAGSADNLVFSPYSISLAFSMLYAGARGTTETQLANTFHYFPQDTQHRTARRLARQVSGGISQANVQGNTGTPFQLNIANAVWGQKGFPFKQTFNSLLAADYAAEIQQVDFTMQSAQIAQDINAWIAKATQDRIKDMVSPDTLDADTQLVLVNAVYFKGSWQSPFNESETKPGTFTRRDGSVVQVPFMQRDPLRATYFENADYQALLLPYVDDRVEMVLLLPKEGRLQAVESELTSQTFDEIRTRAELYDVALSMPRFSYESDLDLSKLLPSLGVTDAFGGSADFSGIAEGGGLYVSDALHHSTITVDEEGTEAAAASAIAMATSMYERAEMNLNHPFLFAIVERETGTLLFVGRVMNPRT